MNATIKQANSDITLRNLQKEKARLIKRPVLSEKDRTRLEVINRLLAKNGQGK